MKSVGYMNREKMQSSEVRQNQTLLQRLAQQTAENTRLRRHNESTQDAQVHKQNESIQELQLRHSEVAELVQTSTSLRQTIETDEQEATRQSEAAQQMQQSWRSQQAPKNINSETLHELKLRMNREQMQRWRARQSQAMLQRLAQQSAEIIRQRRQNESTQIDQICRSHATEQTQTLTSLRQTNKTEEQAATRQSQAAQQRHQSRSSQQPQKIEKIETPYERKLRINREKMKLWKARQSRAMLQHLAEPSGETIRQRQQNESTQETQVYRQTESIPAQVRLSQVAELVQTSTSLRQTIEIEEQAAIRQSQAAQQMQQSWCSQQAPKNINYETPHERKLRMNRDRVQRWRARQSQAILQCSAQQNAETIRHRRQNEFTQEAQVRHSQLAAAAVQTQTSTSLQQTNETDEQAATRQSQAAQQMQQSWCSQQAQKNINYETPQEHKLRMNRDRVQRWRAQRSQAARQSQAMPQHLAQQSVESIRQQRQNDFTQEDQVRHLQVAEQTHTATSLQQTNETDEQVAIRQSQAAQQMQQSTSKRQGKDTEKQSALLRVQTSERFQTLNSLRQPNETEEQIAIRRLQVANRVRKSRAARRPLIPNHDTFNEDEVIEHNCGAMNHQCIYCSSLNFEMEKSTDETFKYCCHKGTVLLHLKGQLTRQFPLYLQDLLSNPNHPHYRNFHDNIRSYNSVLAFASMGAQIDHLTGRGPYVFRVHGQIYHRTGHMHPAQGELCQYAQLYVIDSAMANGDRMQHPSNQRLNINIVNNLDTLIRQNNVYAQAYRMLGEVEYEEGQQAVANNQIVPIVSMAFRRDRNADRRRYNLPTVEEVAMIFRSADGQPPFERDFRVYPRNVDHPLINLNIMSPHLDPMTYVIFYPFGEAGWQPRMQMNLENHPGRMRTQITMLQWKVAQIAVRPGQFNPLLHGGKLFQQWAVDSHLQVEANNLNFVRNQQGRLRVEQYRGLMDHLNDVANRQGTTIGRSMILPSSFQGSPRNMREKYHDAMAIVARYGKPDLFITMTCNPTWSEIKNNLFPGQQPSDRPDLVARIFSMKLKALREDIIKNGVFGQVKADVYTIEFQKRGLPHAHMLFILNNEDKMDTAEKIDRYICAEIPDPQHEPELHEIVSRTMIHGPCGHQNPNAPCMENGECIKKFPKSLTQQTITEVNGYPIYRRRPGVQIQFGDKIADNRFVVPYNKYLTKKYNCHINVESCQSVKSIKYIFKYIYKGYDCASVVLNAEDGTMIHDEIRQFIDTRYVCAPEAIWRLLENPMHDRSHAVYRLAVHLPDEQMVYFQDGQEEVAVEKAQSRFTHLTAWFELNKSDTNARQYFYAEIPEHYVFDTNTSTWKVRKRGGNKIVTRMYAVSPKDQERFHLRMLLQNVPGAQSFADLKTVNGVAEETFKGAAVKLNLLEDDLEWERCLEEASHLCMPPQIRLTFALICIFNSPQNPLALFEQFKEFLLADYIRHFNGFISEKKALQDIDVVFRMHGVKCIDFNLPDPGPILNVECVFDAAEQAQKAEHLIETLNPMQRQIFNEIAASIDDVNVESRFFFLDGPGGSGKTYLYNTLMCYVRGLGKCVKAFATTGIAADLLVGGRTAHSGFKIPLSANETSVSSMKIPSLESSQLKEATLLIIDEASMLSSNSLRVIDLLLREVMNDIRPFGGKLLILGGDFRQTTNVVPRGTVTETIELCIKNSPLWRHVKKRSLITNMRSAGQHDFNEWVLRLGDGNLTNDVDGFDSDLIELPDEMVEKESVIVSTFGTKISTSTPDEIAQIANKVILTPKNVHASELNVKLLQLITGDTTTYMSIDTMISDDPNDAIDFPVEFLHEQCPSGMPPHLLKLKVGAFIMLLRNLNPRKGLLNGTRLVVKSLHHNCIKAEIITGSNKGEEVCIPRINLEPSESSLPFRMRRRQFPVILAFAMTINKSQGQSFDHVGVYLPEPVFAHGQLYVALTRSRNHETLKIVVKNTLYQGAFFDNTRTFTKNIVLKELLI